MNPRSDTDRVLRHWLSDGPTSMPDRVIDVVAERISREPQRRTWRPLRRLPVTRTVKLLAAIAAVLALAVVAWNLLPGRPIGVGGPTTPSAASPTPAAAGAFESRTFGVPIAIASVGEWVPYGDATNSVDMRLGETDMAIMSMAEITLAGPGGSTPSTSFPPDFGAWLSSRPEFDVVATKAVTIGGRAATQIDADFVWVAGSRAYAFLNGWLYDQYDAGSRARFVVVPMGEGAGIVVLMNAKSADFDRSAVALDQLLAGLTFR